jgi:hypothetical protein
LPIPRSFLGTGPQWSADDTLAALDVSRGIALALPVAMPIAMTATFAATKAVVGDKGGYLAGFEVYSGPARSRRPRCGPRVEASRWRTR